MPGPSTYDFSISLDELARKIYMGIDNPDAAVTRRALEIVRRQKVERESVKNEE